MKVEKLVKILNSVDQNADIVISVDEECNICKNIETIKCIVNNKKEETVIIIPNDYI